MKSAKNTVDNGQIENEITYLAAVNQAEWEKGQAFRKTLRARGKKDLAAWLVIGKIQAVVEAKSIELSATEKPNNREIGLFNAKHFPEINAPTLSYAKRFFRNADEIKAYRKAEKLTGTNNPMTLVQGWVKWKAAQERAAAALTLEARLSEMDDETRANAEKLMAEEKKNEKNQKKLQNFLNTAEAFGQLIAEGAFGKEDLKRINIALSSLDDAMEVQLKVKA